MADAEFLADLAELKEAAKVAKQEARKAKIEGQVASVKSAGGKRAVSKLMEILSPVSAHSQSCHSYSN